MLPLQAVLERIGAWYLDHVPAVHATLCSGATDAELDALERHTSLPLPEAFRTLYRWRGGQDWRDSGMFGMSFMSLDMVKLTWDNWLVAHRDFPQMNVDIPSSSYPEGAIRDLYCSPGWLGFLSDGGGNFVGLDFAPGPAGTAGQVITFGRDEEFKHVLASSLDAFLREYLLRLEANRVSVVTLPDHDPATHFVFLLDHQGRFRDGYYVLAERFPHFGAAPGVLTEPPVHL